MKFLLFVALALFSASPVQAEQIDPACANHKGISNLNPFGKNALQVLNKCVKLYCSPKVKVENTRDNLKFIDETLADFHLRNTEYSKAVDNYQKACRALLKKFCQACPLMDSVNVTVFEVQLKGAPPDESAALLRQQGNFSNFSSVISRDESDLACGSQISQESAKLVELHNNTTLRFANTKCDQ